MIVTGRDDGPVVLLAHGFGCDQNMWRLVAPTLAEQFRVVLFDHVGAGNSDLAAWTAERYSTLDGYAADVLEICAELDLHDVVFVGHSVSRDDRRSWPPTATPAASPSWCCSPRLPATSTTADYRGGFSRDDIDELLESLDSNYLGWSAAMAPVIMGNPDRPELGAELTNSFCRTDPAIAPVFAQRHVPVRQPRRPRRGQRAHAGAAVREGRHRPAGGRRVRPRPDPRQCLVTLDATGHCPQLSAPEATAQAIAEFAGDR